MLSWNSELEELRVDGREQPIRSLPELMDWIASNCGGMSGAELEALGGLVVLLAVRDFGQGEPGSILQRSEKALDSFYPVLPDAGCDQFFQRGMETVRERLFPERAGSHDRLTAVAREVAMRLFRRLESEGSLSTP